MCFCVSFWNIFKKEVKVFINFLTPMFVSCKRFMFVLKLLCSSCTSHVCFCRSDWTGRRRCRTGQWETDMKSLRNESIFLCCARRSHAAVQQTNTKRKNREKLPVRMLERPIRLLDCWILEACGSSPLCASVIYPEHPPLHASTEMFTCISAEA